jgi:hypothetical protein
LQKRQKEIKRQEKKKLKAEKRAERKLTKAGTPPVQAQQLEPTGN